MKGYGPEVNSSYVSEGSVVVEMYSEVICIL